ncbi:MAG: acyl-CoA dehydrogenase family protein, partial [Gammaproteobacteria bacterium]|nr:acyl-CoA dehydrogenase family protein [Gammaproteobacteria bacterium]
MDFGLSEEQTLFQDTLNNFLADQVGLDRVRRIAGGEESAGAVWTELAELGVSALLVPEEHGGVGLKPLDAAVAAESLGHHATPSPFLGSAVMGP